MHQSGQNLFRTLLKRALFIAPFLVCSSGYGQMPHLTTDHIRTDLEDFAVWTTKLSSCASSLPESADPLSLQKSLEEYTKLISGETVVDVRRQVGDEHTDLDSPAFADNPEMKAYSDAIAALVLKKHDEVTAAMPKVTSAWCASVQKEFSQYFASFRARVGPVAQKEHDLEKTQHDSLQAATDQMMQGAGQDGRSDIAKMQAAFHQYPAFVQDARTMNHVLCFAAANGDVEGLRFLLAQGAKDATDDDGCIAIDAAIGAGRFDNISFLLDKTTQNRADVAVQIIEMPSEMKEPQRSTLIEQLIHSGLSPDAKSNDRPLLFYAISNSPLMVRTLLRLGADPNATDGDDSAVSFDLGANEGRSFDDFFATGKVDVNRPGPDGSFLIQGAVVSEKPDIVKALLRAGADPNVLNRCGRPVLTLAKKPEIVQALLAAKADPKWTDADGNTLLASIYGAPGSDADKASRLLVAAGLNVNAKNHNGSTILDYSNEFGNPDWILDRSILLSLGATTAAPDRRLTLMNERGTALEDAHYRIQPAGGDAIEGVTDAFGKTSWIPGEQKYTVTDVYDKRCWLAGNRYLSEICVADRKQKGLLRCTEH
jgi:ankyrin repeat protein